VANAWVISAKSCRRWISLACNRSRAAASRAVMRSSFSASRPISSPFVSSIRADKSPSATRATSTSMPPQPAHQEPHQDESGGERNDGAHSQHQEGPLPLAGIGDAARAKRPHDRDLAQSVGTPQDRMAGNGFGAEASRDLRIRPQCLPRKGGGRRPSPSRPRVPRRCCALSRYGFRTAPLVP
jgi:hypothetical protein